MKKAIATRKREPFSEARYREEIRHRSIAWLGNHYERHTSKAKVIKEVLVQRLDAMAD